MCVCVCVCARDCKRFKLAIRLCWNSILSFLTADLVNFWDQCVVKLVYQQHWQHPLCKACTSVLHTLLIGAIWLRIFTLIMK